MLIPQQHKQDLRRIYRRGYEFSYYHFLPDCIAFNQSALRHEQHEDVTPVEPSSFSSEKVCSDHNYALIYL